MHKIVRVNQHRSWSGRRKLAQPWDHFKGCPHSTAVDNGIKGGDDGGRLVSESTTLNLKRRERKVQSTPLHWFDSITVPHRQAPLSPFRGFDTFATGQPVSTVTAIACWKLSRCVPPLLTTWRRSLTHFRHVLFPPRTSQSLA